jgi:hydroxymethylpyrimidine/phosphomethylpyrimidine kinase
MQQSGRDRRPLSVLTIAGSDSGGGAGIQADLHTIAAHGLHGVCAITAITAQNTRGVTAVHPCPAAIVQAQIDAVFDDFAVAAVKIGMLASAELIRAVAGSLRRHAPSALVLDPVMVASSGARLLDADALDALVAELFPLATLVTPNLPEAALLLGEGEIERGQMADAVARLARLGSQAVLLKGGHLGHGEVEDWLEHGQPQPVVFRHPRLPLEGHGTGCTLSAAVACGLAVGMPLVDACRAAGDYIHGALCHASRPGGTELAILGHNWRCRSTSTAGSRS